MTPITYDPIGIARTPFREKAEAPRQASVAKGVQGILELFPMVRTLCPRFNRRAATRNVGSSVRARRTGPTRLA
jgi:hypothetical protein